MSALIAVDYRVMPRLLPYGIHDHPRSTREEPVLLDPCRLRRVQCLGPAESWISGQQARGRLRERGHAPCDVRVLEELLRPEHQRLIPSDWEDGVTCFFGTVLADTSGSLFVPCLRRAAAWEPFATWLHAAYSKDCHAAVLAEP